MGIDELTLNLNLLTVIAGNKALILGAELNFQVNAIAL